MKVNKITIEKAKPEDAEIICDIRDRDWLATYPNPELSITEDDVKLMAQGPDGIYLKNRIAYLKKELAKPNQGDETFFVAKIDGKVVGFINPFTDEQGHHRLGSIYVAPEMHGKGVGGKLIRWVLDWYGRDKDIYLNVVSYNQNAIEIYKHFGFEPTSNAVPREKGRPTYLKDLPEIEMVLRAN